MKATLFFALLNKGRLLKRREKYRDWYEMARVVSYPHFTKESQLEYSKYLWDSSLSPEEYRERERFKREMEERANQSSASSADALKFFKLTTRGFHGHR